ncbi:MAG: hypothetical protein J2P21_13805 [Chloracidobacterium sp.]|nr:hypothetical protein [Chloracidobacterium sp.]
MEDLTKRYNPDHLSQLAESINSRRRQPSRLAAITIDGWLSQCLWDRPSAAAVFRRAPDFVRPDRSLTGATGSGQTRLEEPSPQQHTIKIGGQEAPHDFDNISLRRSARRAR